MPWRSSAVALSSSAVHRASCRADLGLHREVGVRLRHAPDELEPVGEVGRGRPTSNSSAICEPDAPVGPRGVRVQAADGPVGGRPAPARPGPERRPAVPGPPGASAAPGCTARPSESRLPVEGVQACPGLLDLLAAGCRGGEGCGSDGRRADQEHGDGQPCDEERARSGHHPPGRRTGCRTTARDRGYRDHRDLRQQDSSHGRDPGRGSEVWSGRRDLNPRPQRPERCALPNCATSRRARV